MFLYEQRLPRRKVAVKVLLTEELGRDTRGSSSPRRTSWPSSAHPFIVTIFHADVSADGRPYFVMEYCSGRASPSGTSASRSRSRMRCAPASAWPARSRPRTPPASCTATSSPRTCSRTTTVAGAHRLRHLLEPRRRAARAHRDRARRRVRDVVGAVRRGHERAVVARRDVRGRPPARPAQRRVLARGDRAHAARRPHAVRDPGRPNGSLDLIGRIERGASRRSTGPTCRAASHRCSRRACPCAATIATRPRSSSPAPCSGSSSSSATRPPASRCRTSRRSAPRPTTTRTPRVHVPCTSWRRSRARPRQRTTMRPGRGRRGRSRRNPRPRHRAGGTRAPCSGPRPPGGRGRRLGRGRRDRRAAVEVGGIRWIARRRHPGTTAAGVAGGRRCRGRRRADLDEASAIACDGDRGRRRRRRRGRGDRHRRGALRHARPGRSRPRAGPVRRGRHRRRHRSRARRGPGHALRRRHAVTFPVSHADAEDGDRYRWQRADGSGSTEVTDASPIVVAGSTRPSGCASRCRCSAAARPPRPSRGARREAAARRVLRRVVHRRGGRRSRSGASPTSRSTTIPTCTARSSRCRRSSGCGGSRTSASCSRRRCRMPRAACRRGWPRARSCRWCSRPCT